MIDPARHVHPGIPYDFYSGYIVVIAEQLTHAQRHGSHTDQTMVVGQLPRKVQTALEQNWGLYQQVEEHSVKMKMPPVDVLNILGNLGYRVIGTSTRESKQMVWTLELKDFEKVVGHANNI